VHARAKDGDTKEEKKKTDKTKNQLINFINKKATTSNKAQIDRCQNGSV